MTAGASSAATTTCTASGMPNAAEVAPAPPPSTVPMLNAPCSLGIRLRPRRRSTSAPATFIATSQLPVDTPVSTRPRAAGQTVPVTSPAASASNPIPTPNEPSSTTRAAPSRCTAGPDTGSAAHAPPDRQSSSRPSCALDSESASRAAGARDNQDAKHRPLSAKAITTAVLALANASVRGPSISSVTTLPRRKATSSAVIESIRYRPYVPAWPSHNPVFSSALTWADHRVQGAGGYRLGRARPRPTDTCLGGRPGRRVRVHGVARVRREPPSHAGNPTADLHRG